MYGVCNVTKSDTQHTGSGDMKILSCRQL